jgi:hypothetical protein
MKRFGFLQMRTSSEMTFPNILTASVAAFGILSAAPPAWSQTYDPSYPVCLHVYGPVGYFSCRYTSLPQCAPSAVGRSAECVVDPYYAGAQREAPAPRRHRHWHKAG